MPSKFLSKPGLARWLSLMLASLSIAVIWCGFLPWFATTSVMHQRLEFLDDQGIDPSAMFYTELDAMDEILSKTGVR